MTNLHVTLFAKGGAETWVRHVYNIPSHVGLGWTPYRVIVASHGGTLAHTAFLTVKEFKRWMHNQGYSLQLNPHHRQGHRPSWVARFGQITGA